MYKTRRSIESLGYCYRFMSAQSDPIKRRTLYYYIKLLSKLSYHVTDIKLFSSIFVINSNSTSLKISFKVFRKRASLTIISSLRQLCKMEVYSYKNSIVFKKSKLILNYTTVHYLNSGHNAVRGHSNNT